MAVAFMLSLTGRPSIAADESKPVISLSPDSFLQSHCTQCHGTEKQKGKLALHNLGADFSIDTNVKTWQKVLEQLKLGEMPPEEVTKRPNDQHVLEVTNWIESQLKRVGKEADIQHKLKYPDYGNYINHEKLFDGSVKGPAFSPPRLWRINPSAYDAFIDSLGRQIRNAVNIGQPFTLDDNKAVFADFAAPLYADEATLQRLLMNCEKIAQFQTTGIARQVKDRKDKTKIITEIQRNTPAEFQAIIDATGPPTVEQMQAAIKREFQIVLSRDPSDDELQRYVALLAKTIKQGGNARGLTVALTAILLQPESLFRMEIGFGEKDEHGRHMLSSYELAFAIAYSLTDKGPGEVLLGEGKNKRRSPPSLLDLADQGKLETRDDVARVVAQIWDDEGIEKPRILRFFHEFFGYQHAPTIFKGDRIGRDFNTQKMVRDADNLVLNIVGQDKQVLRELLTTDQYFVAYPGSKEQYQRTIDRMSKTDGKNKNHPTAKYLAHVRAKGWNPIPEANPTWRKYVRFYNFHEMEWNFPIEQPFAMPERQRAGLLTHPAWLVAWSGNFDNDVVRRGKWIREHLLAGTIPEIPITVNAVVPDDPHKTLRQRMQVTREAYCWKCHERMDPLALPFESYDDFGRYRAKEQTHDKKNHDVVASGSIQKSGDPLLDGEVKDAIELVNKLANSPRVRQSFVRHAFRYWMGRNETLSDSPTMIAADESYVKNDGSFRAMVISLLTSDSFLYRK